MNEYLSNKVALGVNILYFFSSHVLSLLQFEDVFLAIDDGNGLGLSSHHTDVSSFKPSVLSDGFVSFLLIFVITEEDSRASTPYLASRG